MAPKRPSLLNDPPSAASSDEEDTSSQEVSDHAEAEAEAEAEEEEEEEEDLIESGSESEPENPDSPVHSSAALTPSKESSGTDSDTGTETGTGTTESDSEPIEETPNPTGAEAATGSPAAKSGSKRALGTEPKDSKRPKKNEEPSAGGDESKQPPLPRIWSDEDEITILEAMSAYARKKGSDPCSDSAGFHEFIKKSLEAEVDRVQLQDKIFRLKKKYETTVAKGDKYKPSDRHENRVFGLAKKVFGGGIMGGLSNAKVGKKIVFSEEEVALGMKSFSVLGFSEEDMKKGLELVGRAKQAELKERWRKLHFAELELFQKRMELMEEQTKAVLKVYKSSGN